jgi:hypothetical protein
MREVRGHAKLSAVLPHIHSPMGIGEPGARLRRAAEVIARLPLYRITRPLHRFALDELLDAIESVSPKEDR